MATPSPEYLSFYGCRLAPFSLAADRRFLCGRGSVAAACEDVAASIRLREGLTVVLGPSGVGKTVVCRAALEEIVRPAYLSIVVDPFASIEDLLTQLLSDFGVPDHGAMLGQQQPTRHQLLQRLDRFLARWSAAEPAVVMVDDAHRLAPETLDWLRVLTNLERNGVRSLHLVLAGQPSFARLLDRAAGAPLAERVARRCRLAPMSAADVRAYLAWRLRVAKDEDLDGDETAFPFGDAKPPEPAHYAPFTDAAVLELTALSRGIPRMVNLVADGALRLGQRRRRATIDAALVRQAAAAAGIAPALTARIRAAARLGAVAAIGLAVGIAAPRLWPRPTARAGAPAASARVETPAARPPAPALPAPPSPVHPEPAALHAPDAPIASEPLPRADAHLVVAASFRNAPNADRLAAALRGGDLPAFVRPDGNRGWFSVVVGPYATGEEARDVGRRLEREFSLAAPHVTVER